MKLPFRVVALSVVALLAAQPLRAQNMYAPDQVKYGAAPPTLPAGAELAVLEGDLMGAIRDFTGRRGKL
jgi:hypothetical protein